MHQTATESSPKHIGIDVSKSRLDIHGLAGLASVPNTPEGHAKLIRAIKPGAHRIALEATGGYEERLIFQLHGRGIPVCRIEPSRVRNYAKSLGRKAKNDKIDARSIAQFADHAMPCPLQAPSAAQSELKALCTARLQLVAHRATLTKQIGQTYHPAGASHLGEIAGGLAKQIASIEKRVRQLLGQDEFRWKAERIMAVKGVSLVGASGLLGYMPEAGKLTGAEASALVGVAPFDDQSGEKDGPRSIQGGRSKLRKIIYMNAVCCIRHNKILREHYLRLRAGGKKPKVAIVAVMRKLVVLMNRLLADPGFNLAPEQ